MEFILNTKSELKHMEGRMLDDTLLDKLLEAYLSEMEGSPDKHDHISEEENREASEAFAAALSEAEKDELRNLESCGRDIIREGMRFAFPRGIYAGFLHFYKEKPPEHLFFDLIESKAITITYEMQRVHEALSGQAEELERMIRESHRKPEIREPLLYHLTSIVCAWKDREFGVMRHAFYLGYRYALSMIRSIVSQSEYDGLIAKTLLLEHELAFTQTREERERAAFAHYNQVQTFDKAPEPEDKEMTVSLLRADAADNP